MAQQNRTLSPRHFFVDEAGDGTLFNRHGKCIVGEPGCSRFFIVGAVEISEPERLARELEDVRASLLADPWFKRVPSMQHDERKTARLFHAKDDLPEVRREVFAVLRKHHVKISAAVRNKILIHQSVQQRNKTEAGYRYNPNELYDWTVRRAFSGLLDPGQEYRVVFATRGKSDRTKALTEALKGVPVNPITKQPEDTIPPVLTVAAEPSEARAELQAADYLLWALQRFYENGEERYLEHVWSHYRSVCYMHPKPSEEGSRYLVYNQTTPLTLKEIEGLPNTAKPGI